ncbi:GTPase IMAP family member 4-like, partial [Salminus brasiliensis]|uniref:GTPase IMAP family member 4-like n=1 Tax=Salminus brasiliensis TaxID=930266 RepID=UPI003B8370C3
RLVGKNRFRKKCSRKHNTGAESFPLQEKPYICHSGGSGSVLKRRKQVESRNSSAAERRVVLIGKAGAGKSASGNTILGQKCFRSEFGMKAVTAVSAVKTGSVAGREVSVVDTPGLFDTGIDPEELMKEIVRSVYLSSPGPHALLIVLPLTRRFTAQEQEMIQQIKLLFGEEVTQYAVLLFTNGDQLEGKSIEELIKESSALRELVQQCGGRYHVFNNKDHENAEQVTELLEKIDRMVEQNGGSCYSNQMFEEAERCRREEEERRKREEEEKKQREQSQRQDEIERVIKETGERVRKAILSEERAREEKSSCCIS